MVDNNAKGDTVHETADGYESDFMRSAREAQAKLNTVSPSMCLAKWNQVSLHLPTGLNNSCYHPPLHKMEVGNIHNTQYKKQQRAKMIAGERPEECSYCWNIEDTGQLSDRHYRSGEPWSMMDFDKIVADPMADINPRYVEVNFNHACNFKCSYCSPQFSTSWGKEINDHGAYPTYSPHNAPEHFVGNRKPIPHKDENPYVNSFWEWWPEMYKDLKHFRMTGGEPLMDKNTFKVLDYVIQNPKEDLHLAITSNFNPPSSHVWDRYIEKLQKICVPGGIEHFMQYVSVDTWGKHAEYIRNGLDFDVLWANVHRFLERVPERTSLTFIITYNNLSVLGIKELLWNILTLRRRYSNDYQRIWFDTPILREPAWQSIKLLPEEYQMIHQEAIDFMKENLETNANRLHGFKDYEIQRMERDLEWWKTGLQVQEMRRHRSDFVKFFTEHDRRRGTNFLETFPQMAEFWQLCKNA
tara:strand:+ start:53803 stop:55206 length:1404 start_codon:yes stop_codon:yes gene_type:complete